MGLEPKDVDWSPSGTAYQMWEAGIAKADIVNCIGVCEGTLNQYARRNGWKRRKGGRPPSKEWDGEPYEMWLDGVPAREIARRLGVSGQLVDYHAKARGWPKRKMTVVYKMVIEEEEHG